MKRDCPFAWRPRLLSDIRQLDKVINIILVLNVELGKNHQWLAPHIPPLEQSLQPEMARRFQLYFRWFTNFFHTTKSPKFKNEQKKGRYSFGMKEGAAWH